MSHQVSRLEAAALWRFRLQESGYAPDIARQFEEWRAEHPENAAAFSQIERGLEAFDEVSDHPKLAEARAEAIEAVKPRRRPLVAAVAGVAFLFFAVPAYLWIAAPDISGSQHIETAAGEQRVMILADGSRMTVDGSSVLNLSFDNEARHIELLSGQARFQVAHGDARPFRVAAGNHEVLAVGTDFNVDRLDNRFTVSLITGRVLVKQACVQAGDCVSRSVRLNPGEALSGIDGQATLLRSKMNAGEALAWQHGQIVIRDQSLAVIAQRINRHNQKGRLIVQPSAAALTLSGVFSLSNPDAFVESAVALLPIGVQRTPTGDFLISRQGASQVL